MIFFFISVPSEASRREKKFKKQLSKIHGENDKKFKKINILFSRSDTGRTISNPDLTKLGKSRIYSSNNMIFGILGTKNG